MLTRQDVIIRSNDIDLLCINQSEIIAAYDLDPVLFSTVYGRLKDRHNHSDLKMLKAAYDFVIVKCTYPQSWRCYYCGCSFINVPLNNITIEHFFPLNPSSGAGELNESSAADLVPVCIECNGMRGNATCEKMVERLRQIQRMRPPLSPKLVQEALFILLCLLRHGSDQVVLGIIKKLSNTTNYFEYQDWYRQVSSNRNLLRFIACDVIEALRLVQKAKTCYENC